MKLIRYFVDICLFRAGPADVPASSALMKLTLFSYFISGLIVSRIDSGWLVSVSSGLTDMVVMMAFCWLLLKLRGQPSRYPQTISALAGSGSLLGLIGLPILMLYSYLAQQHAQLASLAMLAVMMLMLWSLMVTAHIFRQAFDIKVATAAIITVIYTFISLLAVGLAMSGAA